MATGSTALLSVRAALGASEGAATTPTRFLYLPAEAIDLSGLQKFEVIEDMRGWAKRDQRADVYAGIESNTIVFNNVPCSFEDLGFILSTIPGIVSGAGTGAGTPTTTDTSAYTRVFTPSQTVTAYGATGGYDVHMQIAYADLLSTVGWSTPGLRLTDFTLNWSKRASGTDTGLTYSATWRTPKTATQITSFTGSLSDRPQTLPTGNVLKSFVDTATMGNGADPEITAAVFHFASEAAFHDGMDSTGLHTTMHFPYGFTSELSLTRKFSDTTELAAYKARTLRKVRLIAEGAVVGAATAKNTIQLDFVGKEGDYTQTAIDGMIYADIPLLGTYDTTQLASWKMTTISTVSAAYTTL